MIINTPSEFGAALRARRKELHYTLAYIAQVTASVSCLIWNVEKQLQNLGKRSFLQTFSASTVL